jgi:hypothetical protein
VQEQPVAGAGAGGGPGRRRRYAVYSDSEEEAAMMEAFEQSLGPGAAVYVNGRKHRPSLTNHAAPAVDDGTSLGAGRCLPVRRPHCA